MQPINPPVTRSHTGLREEFMSQAHAECKVNDDLFLFSKLYLLLVFKFVVLIF